MGLEAQYKFRNPRIYNIDLPVAGVEGSVEIEESPVNGFTITPRLTTGAIQVAFKTGEVDSNYKLLYGTSQWSEENRNIYNWKIFAKSTIAGNALEIVIWR